MGIAKVREYPDSAGSPMSQSLGRFVVSDPAVCHGRPTFRGTRIFVGDVLDEGSAGLIVVYATNLADQVAANIKAANRLVSAVTDVAADELAREIKEAEAEAAG